MNRTVFLVDGFNLYHSARAASADLAGQSTKWLDIRSLLASYLSVIGAGAVLEKIYYFTAIASHLDAHRPGVTARHRLYLECLSATGVVPVLARFKYKTVWCRTCQRDNPHYEEKETDVAISMKIVEVFHQDQADTAVLVTGDTDLADSAEWWAGDGRGWVPEASLGEGGPAFVLDDAGSECSLHRDERSGWFIHIASYGFGASTIGLRTAPALTGPWSPPVVVYRPPESDGEQPLVYAAKAHPELAGPDAADLVVTYATNSLEFGDLFTREGACSLYWPRVVLVKIANRGMR